MRKLMILLSFLLLSCNGHRRDKIETPHTNQITKIEGAYQLDTLRYLQITKEDSLAKGTFGNIEIYKDSIHLYFIYANLKSQVHAKLEINKDSIHVVEKDILKAYLVPRKNRVYYVSLDRKAFIPFQKISNNIK